MFSLEEIVEKIVAKSGKNKQEVKKLIAEKQDELSGLVSEEGAAYMVGRELGVDLIKEGKKNLKVKNVVSGLRSVDLAAKILSISDTREFEKNGKKGAVLNLMLGDETGTIRMPLWNEEIEILKKLGLKVGDVVEIKGGWAKTGLGDQPELGLGKGGQLAKSDAKIEAVEAPGPTSFGQGPVEKANIGELKENQYGEVRASLVQIFKRTPFFVVCPHCDGKLENKDGEFSCPSHGKVEPKQQMILSGVLDDGTGNIRCVFFRDQAEKLIGKTTEELKPVFSDNPLSIYDKFENLGKEFVVTGRIKRSDFSGELEFVANTVDEVDVKKECEDLLKKLKP